MTKEHKTFKCNPYASEVVDGVCQDPKKNALPCFNCRHNKGVSKSVIDKTVEEHLQNIEEES